MLSSLSSTSRLNSGHRFLTASTVRIVNKEYIMYDASIFCSTEAVRKLWGGMANGKKKERTALITNNRKWIHTLPSVFAHSWSHFVLYDNDQAGWIWIGNALAQHMNYLFAVCLNRSKMWSVAAHYSFGLYVLFMWFLSSDFFLIIF